MVYCSKCGTLNSDDANVCGNCGAPLATAARQKQYAPWNHRHYQKEYHTGRGSGFGALFAGIVIILVGLALLFSQIYGIKINWDVWFAIGIVIVGLWLIFVAFRRSRRYSQTQQT
ncbi:MAG: zinc ribbon domain-containing protein [Candidatus Bathyarchaeota archaeon]|nr:zinc ribbon domain-containing protein [Candidatus Bathyarchaeota archaeon]